MKEMASKSVTLPFFPFPNAIIALQSKAQPISVVCIVSLHRDLGNYYLTVAVKVFYTMVKHCN